MFQFCNDGLLRGSDERPNNAISPPRFEGVAEAPKGRFVK